MTELIISVSGLRGVVGDTLTPAVAMRYAAAFAESLPAGPIVTGYDGRASGPMMVAAVETALMASGRRVLSLGPAATPTIGVVVSNLRAAGGVQVSASHNPAEYNGIKLFSGAGRVIPASDGVRVQERFQDQAWQPAAGVAGRARAVTVAAEAHVERILPLVDLARIRAKRFRVLLDANHGAGAVIGARLLERLGCVTRVLGAEPTGDFLHTPEPTAENLAGVLGAVREFGADVGFCQDPDADRLAVIDHTGRYLGEELTLGLCVDHELRRRTGPVVTNCSTSRVTEDLCKKYGAPFTRSAVGEANVVDQMLRTGAVLGGEGNGGVIHPAVCLVRDSMIGMALVLDAMAARDAPVGELADRLPQYSIHKAKAAVPPAKIAAALDRLEAHFGQAEADRMDGLRLDWPDGRWLLVRASNTEPIVRIIAEAATADAAKSLCEEAAATCQTA
ncbi:Phosphomannomutase/phosphoglucomutase [Pirellulimonas nuda]|uniref:Phosphomannomutase/phosphoglucomutase n=1 Tax=Pirellulimonas nuda TaxID=2528009 RepID=A0A518DIS4_9BACT|nr:phosphoglucosamine mutase [Pirellulimonas nuda]QDU91381.1 Phosphomannomutase/phosphoglucomutase [Pirellulimonas nuda]